MAEFQDIIKQKEQMCVGSSCCDCPIDGYFGSCVNVTAKNAEKYEELVMQWAKEHSEKKYPTWKDWQRKEFPDASVTICPKTYMSKEEANCMGKSCFECTHSQIPKEMAEKLGIKPLKGE